MHEFHRGGARVARAGESADHALAEQRVLQSLVGDELVEDVGDGCVEQRVDHQLLAEDLFELGTRGRVADPGVLAGPLRSLSRMSSKNFSYAR